MDAVVHELAEHLVQVLTGLPPDHPRYLVGISGIPGSGKSTLAIHVCQTVNAILSDTQSSIISPVAAIVGMDGWHYPRAHLAAFANAKEAKDRRGAAFTFDAASFSSFVASLQRYPQQILKAPSFDHSLKDPVQEDIEVLPSHRIVIIEGLYCNCDYGDWAKGARLLNERWVVQVSRKVARERLKIRHVQTGVAKDEEEALWRADNNDLPNGDWLLSHLLEPVKRIESHEQEAWAV